MADQIALFVSLQVAVSVTTYCFLRDERYNNFVSAFQGMASTIEVSTLEQQKNIREGTYAEYRGRQYSAHPSHFGLFSTMMCVGFSAMSNSMTGYAHQTNSTWPFVALKYFEMYGANLCKQSLIEAFWIAHRVEHEDKGEFLEWIDKSYEEEVAESFEIDPSTYQYFEVGEYHPYIHVKTDEGFVEDIDRPEYYPLYQQSPAPFNYLLINYNLLGVQDYVDIINASLTLQNETLFTRVRPYSALSDKDHARLHSQIGDEAVDHPHSFVYHPIHEEVANTSSKIVGFVVRSVTEHMILMEQWVTLTFAFL